MYCIHVPGHDPINFSFRSFSFLIGWGGVIAQLSKVLIVVCWAGSEHDKGLVYPTVACALSGVVVSEASRFVALCCRPCRTVIVDRDKLMVSCLLRIFS